MAASEVKSRERAERSAKSPPPNHAFVPMSTPAIPVSGLDAPFVPQMAGNLAMQRMLQSGAIQARLSVSQPDDPYEQEADRVAQQAVNIPGPSVQTKSLAATVTPLVQRAHSAGHEGFRSEPEFKSRLGASGGSPLPVGTRAFMESRFGSDFSGVRLHTGSEAARLNRAVSAEAFTYGQDIYLGGGKDLESSAGKQLLAHELTHTLQQRTAGSASSSSQQADGHAAVQRQTASPTPAAASAGPAAAPPGSVAAATAEAVGAPTSGHAVEARVMLPSGQLLSSLPGSPPMEIHTTADVTVTARANPTGITVSFSPGMVISTRNPEWYIPDVDIGIEELGWSYSTQTLSARWNATNAVNWFRNPGGQIIAGMSGRLAALPARMQVPGYDPFSDPALAGDLTTFARSFAGGGGGSAAPRVMAQSVELGFALPNELTRDVGQGATVVIPAGSRISLQASLDGDLTASPPAIKVTSITLGVSGRARFNLRAFGTDWPIISVSGARIGYGGGITADYRIIHEDIGSALLLLLAAAAVEENPLNAGRIRPDLTVRDAAAHRLVDQMITGKLEPMFADLVRANAGVIPGVNLLDVFGIPAAAGGAPSPATPGP